ncbi:hypothetical protein F5883DRAFT_209491 [Diaporthe sp. PMI_573]|nr:hypothetical protein F5883DRAFT_209491 [Diaporthaceae sp. PMI_573]
MDRHEQGPHARSRTRYLPCLCLLIGLSCSVGQSASQPVSQSVCMPCCSPVNRTHARTHARTQHVFCCMQLQQTCSRTNSVDLISSDPYSASYFFSFPSSLYGVHFNPIHRPGFSMCRPADTFRRSPGFSN